MNLSEFSKRRLKKSFHEYGLDLEYYDPIFNYLVYGLSPGGFWTSALSNDFSSAILHSHQANRIPNLKRAVTWIINCMPDQAWGNYENVRYWLELSAENRRAILENKELIYTPEEETLMALKS